MWDDRNEDSESLSGLDLTSDVVFNRRKWLQTVGLGLVTPTLTGTALGQDGDIEPNVTFEDQTSDGSTVVIAEVATPVDADLVIFDKEYNTHGSENFPAGTVQTNVEVTLNRQELTDSKQLEARLYESEGSSSLTRPDSAYIAVDEPVPTRIDTLVEANPDTGFNYPYYLYAPSLDDFSNEVPPVVEPVNTGTSTDDFEEHKQAAEQTKNSGLGRRIADELTVPFLVPVFPRPRNEPVDWRHYIHQLDDTTMAIEEGPLKRVDLQLLAMVEDAYNRLKSKGYPVAEEDGIMLNGFSASGNFVDRFATLHPEEVTSVTAGGLNGMPVLPIEEADGHKLEYHVGIADLEKLTSDPFNLDAFRDVNRFLYMGEFDTSDTIPYGDAWTDDSLRETALDVYGNHMVDDRFPYAKSVYESVDASAVFRMYEGAAHSPRPAQDDVVEFHQRSLNDGEIKNIRDDLGGNVTELGAHIEHRPKEPAVGEQVTFDASRSAVWDNEIVDFEWSFNEKDSATGEAVTHSFQAKGGHTIALTATDTAGNTYQAATQLNVGDIGEDRSGTYIEFLNPPTAGDNTVTIRHSVSTDATEVDSLRIRIYEETGDQIIETPGITRPGETNRTEIQLSRSLEKGEQIFAVILPPGGFKLDDAQEVALAITDSETGARDTSAEPVNGIDVTLIDENPEVGFNYPYYLYAPSTVDDDNPTPLLVEPVNTGTSSDDFEEHRKAAKHEIESGTVRTIADSLEAPLLVPVFPRPRSEPVDSTHYVHALDDTTMAIDAGPLDRVDLQLLAMVEDAYNRLKAESYPIARDTGIMLNGFSASGNFVERFATLHPEEVISLTAGGVNGMPILPIEETNGHTLNYHVGIADIGELTNNPFNLEAFRDVNRFLYMGEIDMNDTIPYGDAWTDNDLRETAIDVYGTNMQAERFPTSRAIYEEVDASAVFRMYEGVAHNPSPAENDLITFHERTLAGDTIEDIRADLGGGVPNRRAAIRVAPRKTEPGTQVAVHAVDSDVRDAEIESYQWAFGDGDSATGKIATHTYDTPGQYAVTLTTADSTGKTHQSTTNVVVTGEAPGEGSEGEETLEISLSPSSLAAGKQTELTVTITDTTDTPVEGATVSIPDLSLSKTTTADGKASFSIDTTDIGDYVVSVTADGFSDATATVTITAGSGDTPVDYANENGVVDTNGLINAINDWRNNDIDTSTLIETIDVWRSGEQVT